MKGTLPIKRKLAAPTAYKIVKCTLPNDAFKKSLTQGKSHFQDALKLLAGSQRGSVACFDNTRCAAQIKKAALKLKYTVLYAEDLGKLYVQLIDTGEDK